MLNDPQSMISALSGKPVRQDVVDGLKSASQKTGVSFEFLVAQASRESNLNPNAKAPTTSARGLFQFTSQTWLDVFKTNGAKYGQGDLARKIKRDVDGSLEVADPQARKAILDLRQDPEISALMAAEYAKANEKRLENKLGHEVGPSDIYLAHFLGPNGAARFLGVQEKTPDKVAAKLMPAAARHNRSVFFESNNKPRTVAAVYSQVRNSIDGAMQRMAAAPGVQTAQATQAAQAPRPVQPVAKPDQSQQLAAVRAEAQSRQDAARQALMAQTVPQAGPELAFNAEATTGNGAESENSPYSNVTPRVSLPMPPPLRRTPEAQITNPGAFETLMRRVRLSFLG